MTQFRFKPSEVRTFIIRMMLKGLVPYVQGPPGVGKSDIIRSIAKEYNLKVIDLRLSQCTPEDLQGFPMRNGDKAEFVPFNTFPIEGDAVPDGYEGWLLFLDEFSSATKNVQAAGYKLVLDKMVGTHNLHERVMIVCAGNRQIDRAVVNTMSTAMQSRLIHAELDVHLQEWLNWAYTHDIDSRVIGYMHFRGSDALHNFKPDHQDRTFPCPRTWAFASKIIEDDINLDEIHKKSLAGALSDGTALDFFTFCEIYSQLPSIESILADPEGTDVPKESSIRYALTTFIGDNTTEDNISPILKYINRLPTEMQIVFFRYSTARNAKLRQNPEYSQNILRIMRYLQDD